MFGFQPQIRGCSDAGRAKVGRKGGGGGGQESIPSMRGISATPKKNDEGRLELRSGTPRRYKRWGHSRLAVLMVGGGIFARDREDPAPTVGADAAIAMIGIAAHGRAFWPYAASGVSSQGDRGQWAWTGWRESFLGGGRGNLREELQDDIRPFLECGGLKPILPFLGGRSDAACRVVLCPSRLPPMGTYGFYHDAARLESRRGAPRRCKRPTATVCAYHSPRMSSTYGDPTVFATMRHAASLRFSRTGIA